MKTLLTAAAMVATLTTHVMAQVQCKPALGSNDVLINVLTGDQEQGKTRFKKSERARVVFYNINPFAWQYRFTIQLTKVDDSGALSKFLGLLGGVISDLGAASPAGAPVNQIAPQAIMENSPSALDYALHVRWNESKVALQDFQTKHRTAKADYDLIRQPALVCPVILDLAKTLDTDIGTYQDSEQKLTTAIADLKQLVDKDQALVLSFSGSGPDIVAFKSDLITASSFVNDVTSMLKNVTDDDQKLRAAKTASDAVQKDPSAFYVVRYVGSVDVPSNGKISIARRDPTGTADFPSLCRSGYQFWWRSAVRDRRRAGIHTVGENKLRSRPRSSNSLRSSQSDAARWRRPAIQFPHYTTGSSPRACH